MFKVKDLMIDVLASGRGGAVMMPAPTEPTPPPTLSPVATIAALENKLAVIDKLVDAGGDAKLLDEFAFELGRAMVGVRIAALCVQDMATCENNERISPYASQGLGVLRDADFGLIHDQVLALSKWVNERGDLLEKRAAENKKELVGRLEDAVKHLKSN